MDNDNSNNSDNRTQVLLEELNSQFKAFGEGLDMVSQQVGDLKEEVGGLRKEMYKRFDKADARVDKLEKDMNNRFSKLEKDINNRFNDVDKELLSIREEIEDLRSVLKNKADIKRLKVLEARVSRFEKARRK